MKNSIEITVKLFAQYREGRFKVEKKIYPQGISAGEIVKDIGINEEDLPIGVLMINGRHVGKDHILQDGSIFSIFPKVGGG
jgi:molybdopterin converting factor small subunit